LLSPLEVAVAIARSSAGSEISAKLTNRPNVTANSRRSRCHADYKQEPLQADVAVWRSIPRDSPELFVREKQERSFATVGF
jgi:hypothetical protein